MNKSKCNCAIPDLKCSKCGCELEFNRVENVDVEHCKIIPEINQQGIIIGDVYIFSCIVQSWICPTCGLIFLQDLHPNSTKEFCLTME